MTSLTQLVWDCKAIGGMDKMVLMGWCDQVPDGSDLAYASKETVAECIGVSEDTVLRRTKELVKGGWLIATGGKKQWKNIQTPIYQVNMELLMANPQIAAPPPQIAPPQIAAQGSRFTGSMVLGLNVPFHSTVVAQPPQSEKHKSEMKTENLKPRIVEPTPTPQPSPEPESKGHGKSKKSCPDCKEPLQRDVNHFLTCIFAKGRSTLDEYAGDILPRPKSWDEFGNTDWMKDDPHMNKFEINTGATTGKMGAEASRHGRESMAGDGKATPLPNPPVAPAPLDGDEIWDERGRTRDTPQEGHGRRHGERK
jgi:hypothetical protein